jgi:hypothetical protein
MATPLSAREGKGGQFWLDVPPSPNEYVDGVPGARRLRRKTLQLPGTTQDQVKITAVKRSRGP